MHLVRRIFVLWLAVLLVGAPGCMWWHNFSTYFNTVYLAKTHIDAYEAQQRAVVAQNPNGAVAVLNHRWLDEEYLMRQRGLAMGTATPITPSFSQSLSATKEIKNVHLDSAIILGSKVLADKKGTKYYEDALFLVGKAEFYKNDFADAERKFLELLAHYPETKYGADVQVFLARSLLINRHFDTAAIALQRGLSFTANDNVAASSVHRALAELIYARNPDSLSGIAEQLREAEHGLGGEDVARLAYEEGAVDYLNGDWTKAEHAFEVTYSSANDPWLSGEAHVAHALALREEGNLDAAESELRAVVNRVSYGGSQAAARYELAFTHESIARKAVQDDLRSPEFRERYHPALFREYFTLDTMYKNTSQVIISRATFRQAEMYREMGLYDSAARIAAGLVGTHEFSSLAMNEYVSERAASLASFARYRQELSHIDSLETELKKAPTPQSHIHVTGEVPDAEIHLKAMQEALGRRWNPGAPVTMSKEDSVRVQEIEQRLKRSQPGNLTIKDTSHFIDSLHFVGATAHYELGRAYETFGEIPEARTEYRLAATMDMGAMDTARTALKAQTIYAWVELEHQQKNQPVFDSLLQELLAHYGQTIYAEEAREQFVRSTENSPGELAYRAAFKSLGIGGLDAAKPSLLDVVKTYPQEDVAPRSLYAIGEQYEEVERYDSAVHYYRRVLNEYPYSTYAIALRPRLADVSVSSPPSRGQTVGNPALRNQQQPGESPSQQPWQPRQNPVVPSGEVPSPGEQSPSEPPANQQFPPQPPGMPPQVPPGIVRPPMPPGYKPPPIPPNFQPPPPSDTSRHG